MQTAVDRSERGRGCAVASWRVRRGWRWVAGWWRWVAGNWTRRWVAGWWVAGCCIRSDAVARSLDAISVVMFGQGWWWWVACNWTRRWVAGWWVAGCCIRSDAVARSLDAIIVVMFGRGWWWWVAGWWRWVAGWWRWVVGWWRWVAGWWRWVAGWWRAEEDPIVNVFVSIVDGWKALPTEARSTLRVRQGVLVAHVGVAEVVDRQLATHGACARRQVVVERATWVLTRHHTTADANAAVVRRIIAVT